MIQDQEAKSKMIIYIRIIGTYVHKKVKTRRLYREAISSENVIHATYCKSLLTVTFDINAL